MMPGHNGGANWGSSAVDPAERPALHRLEGAADDGESARAATAGAGRDSRPRRSAAGRGARGRRQPAAAAPAAERGPRLHPVHRAGRLHDSAEHRLVGDRAAVVADHGLRPEQGHDHLADTERRRREPGGARASRAPAVMRRAAASSRRAAGCCSSARRRTASSARTMPTPATCCGVTICPRRRKACRRSTRSAAGSTSRSRSAATACSAKASITPSPARASTWCSRSAAAINNCTEENRRCVS